MRNIAVFDVDGVVAGFEPRLIFALVTEFGDAAYKNRSKYSLEERFENDPSILRTALELTADPNFYYALPANEPMVKFIEELYSERNLYNIFFLSSRPYSAQNFTNRWLKKNIQTEFRVVCGVGDKAGFLSGVSWKDSIDFVVDDNPNCIKSLTDAGLRAICADQEWNEGIFPRMYARSDGEIMIWERPDEEAHDFFVKE